MKALYSSALVPECWIAAHGLEPCRLQPNPTASAPPAGACPYAWCWLQNALAEPDAACLIFTTECDPMRRLAEAAAAQKALPVFLFNIPKAAGSPVARAMIRAELERLGRFLVRCGGHPPARGALGELIRAGSNLEIPLIAPGDSGRQNGVPLAIVGGPLMPGHAAIFELIERAGGTIVLDATETGELGTIPAEARELSWDSDPVDALAALVGEGLHSVHRRPNTALYEWLAPRLAERAVRGILFVYYPWCDAWHAEARRLDAWSGLPVLPVVLSADGPLNHHLASRIEAFMEALR